MGKFDGVLIASDFDGTLRDESQQFTAKANQDAIDYFCENGGHFAISTGRDIQYCEYMANMVRTNAPMVVTNGGTIYDIYSDTTYFSAEMSGDIRGDIKKIIARYPEVRVEIRKGKRLYVVNGGRMLRKYHGCALEVARADLEELDPPYNKVEILDDVGLIKTGSPDTQWMIDILNEHYAAFAAGYIIDITDKGIDKGTGVLKLCDILGVSPQHLYTIGDSGNDIPMLRAAKRAFVPKNAYSDVLRENVTVLSSARDGAVKDMIDILDAIY